MKTTSIYVVALTDSVRYTIEVEAANEALAKKQAVEIWREDFLRFKPISGGKIHDVRAQLLSEFIMTTVAGGVL